MDAEQLHTDIVRVLEGAVSRLAAEHLKALGLRVQWAALYEDGTWTSGERENRAEAEEIISGAPEPKPVLAQRWVGLWRNGQGADAAVETLLRSPKMIEQMRIRAREIKKIAASRRIALAVEKSCLACRATWRGSRHICPAADGRARR